MLYMIYAHNNIKLLFLTALEIFTTTFINSIVAKYETASSFSKYLEQWKIFCLLDTYSYLQVTFLSFKVIDLQLTFVTTKDNNYVLKKKALF